MERKKKLIALLLLTIFLLGIIIASYKLFFWTTSDVENAKIKNKIEENIKVEEKSYNIDFEKLKKQNKDTVAYLKVNNTNVNYVVVQGKDNDYYLHHNFKKKSNVAGWIFVDYRNKLNGYDRNTIIYGHNMSNKTMFGSLQKTLKKSWYTNKDNQIIVLVTENGTNYYQIFSIYSIPVETYYINTQFANSEEFYEFLKVLRKRSVYDFNVSLELDDQILTLSTCNSRGKKRTVIHAKLIRKD